jgi:DNA-binding transcriptional LysR family regulator
MRAGQAGGKSGVCGHSCRNASLRARCVEHRDRRETLSVELRHLRYFIAVAEERSFTRAAERLWIAQPGLSTHVRRLETELGVRLLDRHARGVEVTDAGQRFLARARDAVDAADRALALGDDLAEGVVGAIRLGIETSARWRPTTELLASIRDERPGLELAIFEACGAPLWRELRDRRLDAMIASTHFLSPDLSEATLGTEPWVVLAGARHRLSGQGPLAASELAGERFLVSDHPDAAAHNRAVADVLRELDAAAKLIRCGPDPSLVHAAVADGSGLALTTAPGALLQDVSVRPLIPEKRLSFALMWADDEASPALRAFVALAEQIADGCRSRARPALVAA